MQGISKQDILKAVVAAVIILGCIFAIFRVYVNEQPHVGQQINLPPGSSEKAKEMRNGGGDSPSDNIDPSKFKH